MIQPQLHVLAMPSTADLASLEEDCCVARELVTTARTALQVIRLLLDNIDERARKLHRARKAIVESRLISVAAARAAGLAAALCTSASQDRFRRQEAAALDDLHKLLHVACPICDQFESALDDLREARAMECEALEALLKAQDAILSTSRAEAVAAMGARLGSRVSSASRRYSEIEVELTRVKEATVSEQKERKRVVNRECTWLENDTFDPKYDEYEIALRRARPWV